jgi:hypothetical protein
LTGGTRQIVKGKARSSLEVADVLASLLLAELLDPGDELYFVSAWISDIPLIDNSAGAVSGLESSWEERWLSLSEVLVALMRRGTNVYLKTNIDPHNQAFTERLLSRVRAADVTDRCHLRAEKAAHSKGIVGRTFAVRGSMNLTYHGLRESEETIEIDVDTAAVATLRLEFSADWREA